MKSINCQNSISGHKVKKKLNTLWNKFFESAMQYCKNDNYYVYAFVFVKLTCGMKNLTHKYDVFL